VIVEMYIELHAPPEQMVRGVDNDDKILRITYLTTEGESCLWLLIRS